MALTTLFSDFGLRDASVAIAKGILMQYTLPGKIVDITHEVQPFNTKQAAYLFGTAYRNFAHGTCHLLMFDIYAAKQPKLILAHYKQHYFLTPDNELLIQAIKDHITDAWLVLQMEERHSFHDWLHAAGRTISALEKNTPEQLALQPYSGLVYTQEKSTLPYNRQHDVVHVDEFENVVVDLTRQQYDELQNGRQFRIQFTKMESIDEIRENYSDVREGTKLCRFNSNGYLEICVNHGKAASLFGLKPGGKNNNILISFT